MAAKTKQTSEDLSDILGKQLSAAKDAQQLVRARWHDRELLSLTKLANSDQKNRKSRISLGDLSTIVLERSGRTVAQLPSGKIRPASKMDEVNCKVLELVITRYVIPNANDQFPLNLKMFLVDYLSDVYGGIDVLSYWRVDDEYIGPDCQILNPRDVFWQAGKRNKRQAEYVFVSTFVSKNWLEKKKDVSTWDKLAIQKVLDQINEDGTKPSAREDSTRMTANDALKNTAASWGDTAEIELVTKYEKSKKGKWTSFLPDFDNVIVRTMDNTHPTGKLPVKSKEPQLPLIDSINGQGAFERGESLQKTLDSVTNLTHDGLKFSVYPVQKYVGTNVQRSTLKYQAGAFWNVKQMDDVGVHHQGSDAINTFMPIQQFLSTKMLNQNGTTSTQVSATDQMAGFGKTPEALKAQGARESTMDRLSRDRLESFWGELMEDWIAMLTNKQEKPIEFYVYDDEINYLKDAKNVDVQINKGSKEVPSGEETKYVFGSAKVTVPKGKLAGQYKYLVDTSSSMLKDDNEEHDRLGEIMLTALKVGPDAINAELAKENKAFSLGETFKRWIISGGVKDWDEIITDAPQQPQIDPMQAQMMQQQMMQPQQMPPQAMPPMQQMPQQMMQQPTSMQPPMADYQPSPETMQLLQHIQSTNPFAGVGNGQ